MASPVVESVATDFSNSQLETHTVNLPASIESDDLLLMFATFPGTVSALSPSGWTKESGALSVSGANGRVIIFSRIADGHRIVTGKQ